MGARGAAVRSCTSTGGGGRVPEAYTRRLPWSPPIRPGPGALTGHSGVGRDLRSAGPLPAEVILEPYDVVELGCRDLDQRAALDRLVAVDPARWNTAVLAWTELLDADGSFIVLEGETQPPG